MPDADDFDVEELRALLRGESPRKDPAPVAKTKTSPAKPRGSSRTAAKTSARPRKSGKR
jgi:hypothetical protein